MGKNIPLLRIKKAIAKRERHKEIVDILNRYAVCDIYSASDFFGDTKKQITTRYCALMNVEELARKIQEVLCSKK